MKHKDFAVKLAENQAKIDKLYNASLVLIQEEIKTIPDNPDCKQLSTTPHCCMISMSNFTHSKILSPSYYDTAYQRGVLLEVIKTKKTMYDVAGFLRQAIKNKKVDTATVNCDLHPDTLAVLENILKGVSAL